MTRRRLLRIGALGIVLIGGAALVAVGTGALPSSASAADAASASGAPAVDRTTATVSSRTMTVQEELDGTLGFAGERRVVNGLMGTVTAVPRTGKVIDRGDRLYELDGKRRPILFYGARPAWRTLEDGVDGGHDITQLEQNLKALGFTRKGDVIDTEWDDDTTRAVKRWQKATGQTVDGIVESGEVVFLPGAVRVTDVAAELGANVGPGTPILSGTTDQRVVTVDLAADRTDLVKVGDPVEIELADGSLTAGTISEVGTVAESGTDAFGNPISPTVIVTVGLDDPAASAAYTNSPVTVRIVRDSRADVMAVPVASLLAILEGGYAVEVVEPSGSTRLVAVETGLFQDGWVEVTAPNDDLTVGAEIVVPS